MHCCCQHRFVRANSPLECVAPVKFPNGWKVQLGVWLPHYQPTSAPAIRLRTSLIALKSEYMIRMD